MAISKFSTLTEMKDYVRKNKLNKDEIRLNMKKSVMLAALDKGGHIHTGPRGSKKAPKDLSTKGGLPVKKTAPVKKDEPLTKEQYNKLVKGSAADLTPALRKKMTDYQQKQIKGAKANAYNKPFLIVNDREIWVDNKYIMKLGDQMENRDSKILGYFTKNDLWGKYNKYKYPKDPPQKKGLKFTEKDEGSLDLSKFK